MEAFRHRLIPAVPVPFDARGRVASEAQKAYARWMADQSVGGVALWVHTGRGLWLSDDQRQEVLETWRTEAPALPVICGVGVPRSAAGSAAHQHVPFEEMIRHCVLTAESARKGGATALMVHPPAPLRASPDDADRVVELHLAVAGVGPPVIAFYLYEAAGGVAYSPELVGRLLEIPGVRGIKLATLDSVMTFQDLTEVVRQRPDALLITGEDRFLGYSLMAGADAALVGMGAACTDRMTSLVESWFGGRLDEFVRISAAVDRFARATFRVPMEGYVQRMLWALHADGVLDRPWHDPFGPRLSAEDHERVRRAVAELRRVT